MTALRSKEKGLVGKSLDAGGEEAPAARERMASTEEKGLIEGEGVVKAGCKAACRTCSVGGGLGAWSTRRRRGRGGSRGPALS